MFSISSQKEQTLAQESALDEAAEEQKENSLFSISDASDEQSARNHAEVTVEQYQQKFEAIVS